MNMPNFTGEVSLYKTKNHYMLIADGVRTSDGGVIIPQAYDPIDPERPSDFSKSCWGVVLGCRDHCTRVSGASFSSLWYVCGVCFGLFGEFFELEYSGPP